MPKAWFCSVCGRSAFQLWRGFIEGFLLDSFECILAMFFVCNSHLLIIVVKKHFLFSLIFLGSSVCSQIRKTGRVFSSELGVWAQMSAGKFLNNITCWSENGGVFALEVGVVVYTFQVRTWRQRWRRADKTKEANRCVWSARSHISCSFRSFPKGCTFIHSFSSGCFQK